MNLHNRLASIDWRFNYFANSILAPKHFELTFLY